MNVEDGVVVVVNYRVVFKHAGARCIVSALYNCVLDRDWFVPVGGSPQPLGHRNSSGLLQCRYQTPRPEFSLNTAVPKDLASLPKCNSRMRSKSMRVQTVQILCGRMYIVVVIYM